ncbi:MAG TPA: putative LPS assembly protein LptD [Bryobacteraceae bacterium]|nr:putative LPS assembly protein LptD [Bryobacteraceae bacterium]
MRIPHPNAPPKGTYLVRGVDQETEGSLRHLRGHAEVETSDMLLKADAIDWNEDTNDVEMRGHVEYENYVTGEKLQCDRAEYNIDDEQGKFYNVKGSSPSNVQARPGLLTTSNPFYFEGKWAERNEDKYIVHEGFVTDCKMPSPWWVLRGPKFDVIPGDRAIAYHATFVLHKIPLIWMPAFYKSLKKEPRRSGFLAPNIGNSSLRGRMVGIGYYWAISRSYDLMYRLQYFTQQTFAHTVDFRGKVNDKTDFNFSLYGVNDHGVQSGNTILKATGYQFWFGAKSDLGHGWEARVDVNYLSSFLFRQEFSQSFNEAIISDSHSVGYLMKHWDSFGFYTVVDRDENFLSTTAGDTILIRKLPEFDFLGRESEVNNPVLPFWWSFNSSFGLLDRTEPDLQTRQFVPRADFAPRVTTAFHWAGISLMPSFSVEETGYGSSLMNGSVVGANLLRNARLVDVDLVLPSLERTFKAPKWMGDKVKHVIEPRVTYHYANGVANFNDLIRFDETELLSDTNELDISITNRLYTKQKDGKVNDLLDWTVSQSRYFDPTFGGAVVDNQRNVLLSSAYLTGFAFIDQTRNYSPVVSDFRFNYRVNLSWRADYDPLRGHIVNSTFTADTRFSNYFVSFGSSQIRSVPVLSPSSNQIRGTIGIGNDNRKGFNAGMSAYYDIRQGFLQFTTVQAVYNTDCCGISVQFRRFNFGLRDENQILFSFAISNVGTFGSLRRQDRTF